MEKTTSRKLARARLLERQQAVAAAREARERANIGDLTEFTVRAAQVEEVDDWYAARVEKLKAEAEHRREGHRRAAGKALQAMRLRGETVTAIAAATGLSISRVREFLRVAAEAGTGTGWESDAVSCAGLSDAQPQRGRRRWACHRRCCRGRPIGAMPKHGGQRRSPWNRTAHRVVATATVAG